MNLIIIDPSKSNPENPTQTKFSNFLIFSFASEYFFENQTHPLKSEPQNLTLAIAKVSKWTHASRLLFLSDMCTLPSTKHFAKACWRWRQKIMQHEHQPHFKLCSQIIYKHNWNRELFVNYKWYHSNCVYFKMHCKLLFKYEQ